jgi:hypothetical protein
VAIPEGSLPLSKTDRGFVLATGEATGHAHVITEDIECYEKDGILYIKTDKAVDITHEEHLPVTVFSGIWKCGIVREFDAFENEARNVKD